MNSRVEILAPAGSIESMMAAVHAGADAIYMGGSSEGTGGIHSAKDRKNARRTEKSR